MRVAWPAVSLSCRLSQDFIELSQFPISEIELCYIILKLSTRSTLGHERRPPTLGVPRAVEICMMKRQMFCENADLGSGISLPYTGHFLWVGAKDTG